MQTSPVLRFFMICVFSGAGTGVDLSAAESPPENPQIGRTWTNTLGMVFCWCPPGEAHVTDQQGTHRLRFNGFWMGKTEFRFADAKALRLNIRLPEGATEQHPLTQSPDGCRDIPKKLNETGRSSDRWYYALPSEAEWEYACRAGSTAAYSFGDDLSQLGQVANFADRNLIGYQDSFYYASPEHDDGWTNTAPVGSLKPNAWGLHDMHGNLWEICDNRVGRGGAWCSVPEYCRASFRHDQFHGRNSLPYIGLRVMLRKATVERIQDLVLTEDPKGPTLNVNLPLNRSADQTSPLVVLLSTSKAKPGAHQKSGGIVSVLAREGVAVVEYYAAENSNQIKDKQKTVAGRNQVMQTRVETFSTALKLIAGKADAWRLDINRTGFMGNRDSAGLAAFCSTWPHALSPRALFLLNGSYQVGMHPSNKDPVNNPDWKEHVKRWSTLPRLGPDSPPAFVVAGVDSWVPHSGRRKPYEQAAAFVETMKRHGAPVVAVNLPEGRGSFDIGRSEEAFRKQLLQFLHQHLLLPSAP